MSKNTFKNQNHENRFYLGLFGYSWRICTNKEVKSFGFCTSPDSPAALSGSFNSLSEAELELSERNRAMFV